MAIVEMWTFTNRTTPNVDLTGFKVEATDGGIGKVDESTNEAGKWIPQRRSGPAAGDVPGLQPGAASTLTPRRGDMTF